MLVSVSVLARPEYRPILDVRSGTHSAENVRQGAFRRGLPRANTNQEGVVMTDKDQFAPSRQRVAEDFRALIADTEELLRASASLSEEGVAALRERVQAQLDIAKGRLAEAQSSAVARARAACADTDRYVHDNPWQAVAAGAAVGFVFGILLSR
jgi:ElaB/YqjD/DUF883 family membrane-anchored ribosome-binding protein